MFFVRHGLFLHADNFLQPSITNRPKRTPKRHLATRTLISARRNVGPE